MSKTQNALLLKAAHGQFGVESIPIETPGPGEVLIKVHSAALNPVDWTIQKHSDYIISDGYPAVLGSDIAGEVEDLGEGVADFKKGDRVVCQSEFKKMRGGFQQYVVALAARVSKIPSNVSYDAASTLPMGLTTAYSGMYSSFPTGFGLDKTSILEGGRGKYADTPILILGGAGSVGQYAIQLARLAGFAPIMTTSSPQHVSFLRHLGATHIIDRRLSPQELKASVPSITSKPITFVYDCIATPETQQVGCKNLAQGGRLILVQPPTEEIVKEAAGEKEVGMAIAAVNLPHNEALLKEFYHDVVYGLLESGALEPNRFEILPNGLAGIEEGLKRLEAGQVSRSKLVAHPQDN